MKELSIEEKAKRYDEALEAIKSLQEANPSDEGIQNWVKDNFPELKESEDEKIRKRIISALVEWNEKCSFPGDSDDMIAWLEKQGEPNPAFDIDIPFGAKDSELIEESYYIPEGFHAEIEGNNVVIKKGEKKPAWNEEDEAIWAEISDLLREGYKQSDSKFSWDDIRNWVNTKLLKGRVQPQPKQEWSKEDKKIIDRIESEFLALHRGNYKNIDFNDVDSLSVLNWVRKIKSLCFYYRWKPSDEQMEALEYYMHALVCNEHKEILFGLYSDLKKLREE